MAPLKAINRSRVKVELAVLFEVVKLRYLQRRVQNERTELETHPHLLLIQSLKLNNKHIVVETLPWSNVRKTHQNPFRLALNSPELKFSLCALL